MTKTEEARSCLIGLISALSGNIVASEAILHAEKIINILKNLSEKEQKTSNKNIKIYIPSHYPAPRRSRSAGRKIKK